MKKEAKYRVKDIKTNSHLGHFHGQRGFTSNETCYFGTEIDAREAIERAMKEKNNEDRELRVFRVEEVEYCLPKNSKE